MKKNLARIISIILSVFTLTTVVSAKEVTKENENVVPVFHNEESDNKKLPVSIKAKSAVLMDASTGKILVKYNENKKLYPASVTKIMTVLLVCEAIDNNKIKLSDKVTCSSNAAAKGGSQIWLEEGEQMTVDELLRATVIGSANDAATLLGEFISGSEEAFVALMNKRAKELKMNNTHFDNATGLDDETKTHLTTAEDIAIMSRELLKHKNIENYTTLWMDSLRNGKTELVNTNKLVRFYKGTTGLKTGTTAKAGCCISASARKDDLHLIAVVMGSENSKDRFNTAKALLNWGFANYSSVTPKLNKNIKPINIIGGKEETVSVKVPNLTPVLVKKGEEENVKTNVILKKDVKAPVEKGETLGKIQIKIEDKVVAEYKLLSPKSIGKITLWDSFCMLMNFMGNGYNKSLVKP